MARIGARPASRTAFVTGRRHADWLLCLLGAILITAAGAARLRVYYQVTVFEVSLERVSATGTRESVPLPDEFRRADAAAPPAVLLNRLERQIDAYMAEDPPALGAEPGARFEWTIRYSHNSGALDQQRVIVFDGSPGSPP